MRNNMTMILNLRKLLVLLFVSTTMTLSGCDDDESQSGTVELLSFGPSGVWHGEDITFIGNRLDKVTSIILPPNIEVPSSSFKEHTSERIVLTVPVETMYGKVILKTPDLDIESKAILGLTYEMAVTSIPVEAKPGTDITITGEFLNYAEEVWFAEGKVVTEFVSQSRTELVVTVPLDARTGNVVVSNGALVEPVIAESESPLTVTLPTVTALDPVPVERATDLTLTGTNLDLVSEIIFKGGAVVQRDAFVSQDVTQLVVTVPAEANKGTLTLIAFSGVEVETEQAIELVGDLPPLAPLAYAFYVDALQNGWGNWGWGGAVDFANVDNVRDGEKSIKKTYDGSWDALRFGGGSVDIAGKTHLVFSVFGDAGTGGKKLQLIFNEQWSSPSHVFDVVEGEWVEISLPLADIGAPATIKDILWQAQGWSGTVYVDHVGFR